jgi:hypothetical protein
MRLQRGHVFAALVVAMLVGVVWLPLVQTGSQPADSSEWVLTALTGHLAHPPGYPLWSWLCEHVWGAAKGFGATNPYAVLGNLNALVQAAAAALWVLALGSLGASPLVAGVAMACWVLLPSTGVVTTYVEVFPFHHLLAAGLVLWCGRWWWQPQQRSPMAMIAFGGMCGFAFAHHQTIVLWAPLVAASAWVSSPQRRGLSVLWFVVGIVLGLSPYLHLLQRHAAAPALSMAPVTTLWELKATVLREMYGTLAFGAATDRTAYAVWQWLSELPMMGIVAMGWCALLLRRHRLDAVLVLVAVLHVCFMVALRVSEGDAVAQVSERFFPLAWLGLLAAVSAIPVSWSRFTPLTLAVPLMMLSSTREHGNAADDGYLHEMREQLVARVSPRTVVVVHTDADYFGIEAEAARQGKALIAVAPADMMGPRLGARLSMTFGVQVPPFASRQQLFAWLQLQHIDVVSVMHPKESFEPDAHPLWFHPGVRWSVVPPSAAEQTEALLEWCDRLSPSLLTPSARPSSLVMATLALHPVRALPNYGDVVDALARGGLSEARQRCRDGAQRP